MTFYDLPQAAAWIAQQMWTGRETITIKLKSGMWEVSWI